MKTKGKLKIVFGVAILAILGITLSSHSSKSTINEATAAIYLNTDNVNITINSGTTQTEFEDIMDLLKEHDIKASFTNIKRNDEDEIVAIKIELEDLTSGSKSVSNMQSSSPIQEISFGRKNDALYITQGAIGFGNFAFFGNGGKGTSFSMDSIFGNRFKMMDSLHGNFFNFNDDDDDAFFFNGNSFNMDAIMEGMNDMFTIEEGENGEKRIIIKGDKGNGMNFFWHDDDETNDANEWHSKDAQAQKFKFYDDPDTEKLIVIDGKEDTFYRLNTLAKEDKLDTVDVLKGKTAVSIYGKKAKDGAIIATTKE